MTFKKNGMTPTTYVANDHSDKGVVEMFAKESEDEARGCFLSGYILIRNKVKVRC